MEKTQILNLEPEGYSREAAAILKQFAEVKEGPLTPEELRRDVSRFDALIVRFAHGVIGRELMEKGTRLKAIATATTGLNHIDLQAARERGISVLSLRGETEFLNGIYATPEYTFALLLALIRKIPDAVFHVRSGEWNRDQFKGTELYGKTLGIIGFGRVGKNIARYAEAFGMEVLAYDIKDIPMPSYARSVSLEMLLKESDVISLCVTYDDATHHMIDEEAFAAMKRGVLIVNTSRGEVINEEAFLVSLESGHVAGASVDVLGGELAQPIREHPLVRYAATHTNLLITPHVAGATAESMEKTEIFIAEKLRKFFAEVL
ncbi:MAG: NAD(P)-dependent oxidoreductase [Candidatus Yanofskybacteria bacterium]|nr:NAD(P)-dependent oxidoreductase [Candidatus Yanofskybacteria bacterium]